MSPGDSDHESWLFAWDARPVAVDRCGGPRRGGAAGCGLGRAPMVRRGSGFLRETDSAGVGRAVLSLPFDSGERCPGEPQIGHGGGSAGGRRFRSRGHAREARGQPAVGSASLGIRRNAARREVAGRGDRRFCPLAGVGSAGSADGRSPQRRVPGRLAALGVSIARRPSTARRPGRRLAEQRPRSVHPGRTGIAELDAFAPGQSARFIAACEFRLDGPAAQL